MEAGKLDRRITIQQATVTRGAGGGETRSWTTLATVWANVRPMSGREFVAGQRTGGGTTTQQLGEVTTTFQIRYRSDVVEKMRISYDSKTYNIRAVLPSEDRKRFLTLACTEGTDSG